ncbi:Wall-associated receptor kinase-like [Thalictrum thalictroides]|uniref:Wall-associated receptor kinase-like n=1 Tax=Thalictrum thalictroides TaxID=46969 RepID=A0A7J6WZY0_THATH|nr:Wall-associated receptor kinase-like [Thalictrum thalictroides]
MAITTNSVVLFICFLLTVIAILPVGVLGYTDLLRGVSGSAVVLSIILNLLIVIGVHQKYKYDGKTNKKKEEEGKRVKLEEFKFKWFQFLKGGSRIEDKFHIFSINEVAILTENYDPSHRLHDADAYRGSLLGEEVIVKRGFNVSKKSMNNFLMVARILYEERHRNIVRVLGGCFECCCPVLIFENVGCSMEIKLPTLSWPKRLQLVKDIATGLLYLQVRDIFHGDLSPSTIFLDTYDEVKIAMFDLSLMLGEQSCYNDPTNKGYGTATDVYSFGIIVCELVTGLSPKSSSPAIYKDLLKMYVDEFILHIDDRAGTVESIVWPLRDLLKLAVQCTETKRHRRPTVVEIVGKVEMIMEDLEKQISTLDQSL